MNLAPYRIVLAQPGVRRLMVVGLLARVPLTAIGMVITLHVVTSLDMGYAEAGIAGALGMAGAGVGSPLAGRLVDRLGARPVIAVTTVAQAVYWAAAPSLGYLPLVVFGFLAGALSIPLFSVMRQFAAAMVPGEQRRTAFALDSMVVELCFMVGPALGVAGVTTLGSPTTMYALGAGLVFGGVAIIVLNPPIRSADEEREAAGRRWAWLNRQMIMLLGVTAATTFVLAGTELAIVATLRGQGSTGWAGLVIAVWCAYSLVGGFVYGALRTEISPLLLVGGLAVFTVPVGALTGAWPWLLLLLIPAGVLCAPSLAATVDSVSRWVPAGARGEAMGLHGTALTIGIALGAPAAGAVIDAFGPAWGFAAAGGVGAVLVALAVPFWPRDRSAVAGIETTAEPAGEPAAETVGEPGARPTVTQAV
jgi:MFS family permease